MAGNAHADVVIVGAGIWGLSVAYHIASTSDKRVVIIERGSRIADETTRQAAGQIGQLRSNPVLIRAVAYTLDLMSRFEELTGHDPHFTQTGSLHVALTPQRDAVFEHQLETASSLDIEVVRADADQITRLSPALNQAALEGAIFLPADGYVEAHACALAFAAAVRDLGVEICTQRPLTGIHFQEGRIAALETGASTLQCDAAVITVGPWARRLLAEAGFATPVQPIRLQQARTAPLAELPPRHPVVRIPDESCYLRPERGGYLYGYFDPDPLSIDLANRPADFSTSELESEPKLIDHARRRLAPVFPILDQLAIDQYRQGMVGGTPDGRYVVGRVPATEGLWVASGCGGMGIAGSAAVGRWLASWVLDGNPGEDLAEFAPDRFGSLGEQIDWVREQSEQTFKDYYALPGTQ